jgi:hypothetical protein
VAQDADQYTPPPGIERVSLREYVEREQRKLPDVFGYSATKIALDNALRKMISGEIPWWHCDADGRCYSGDEFQYRGVNGSLYQRSVPDFLAEATFDLLTSSATRPAKMKRVPNSNHPSVGAVWLSGQLGDPWSPAR